MIQLTMKRWLGRLSLNFALVGLMVTLSGCVIYKTRVFKQTNDVSFEGWNVSASVTAFSGSSGASWDDHDFWISARISRYPEYLDTRYDAITSGISAYSGGCDRPVKMEMGEIEIKKSEDAYNHDTSARAINKVYIESDIEKLCIRLEAEFPSKSGDPTISKTFEIDMKRHESSFPGPPLD
ncbi:MAG: hypothetical protein ACSHXY_06115 [Alphaproteobacteria bacterium]